MLRGIEGFGGRSRLHTAKFLRLSSDLPVIIEIVDTIDKIEAFLPIIDEVITGGLATVEKVQIRFYRGAEEETNEPAAPHRRSPDRRNRCHSPANTHTSAERYIDPFPSS